MGTKASKPAAESSQPLLPPPAGQVAMLSDMGVEKMKKLEYLWYIGGEFSRLVYCDLGIMAQALRALGLSPDILEAVITTYDWKYLLKRRKITGTLFGGIPAPESYTLGGAERLARLENL